MPFHNLQISEEKIEENKKLAETSSDGTYLIKGGKTRRPTIKQKKFVKRVIETGNPTQAAMEVYATKKRVNARAIAHATMQNPGVQILLKKYITDEEALQTLKEQLTATTIKGKDDIEVSDNMARLKAVDITMKLKGAYPTDAVKLQLSGNNQINFIVSRMDPSEEVNVIEGAEEKEVVKDGEPE
jgi:hypothetical protein